MLTNSVSFARYELTGIIHWQTKQYIGILMHVLDGSAGKLVYQQLQVTNQTAPQGPADLLLLR
jgi:hypothetical protein